MADHSQLGSHHLRREQLGEMSLTIFVKYLDWSKCYFDQPGPVAVYSTQEKQLRTEYTHKVDGQNLN